MTTLTVSEDSDLDMALVGRMQAGDPAALSEFYHRWFCAVHRLVSMLVGSTEDAEDVVQETFWQVWRQANRFSRERGSVKSWLLTIGRSRALDRARSERSRRQTPIDE